MAVAEIVRVGNGSNRGGSGSRRRVASHSALSAVLLDDECNVVISSSLVPSKIVKNKKMQRGKIIKPYNCTSLRFLP